MVFAQGIARWHAASFCVFSGIGTTETTVHSTYRPASLCGENVPVRWRQCFQFLPQRDVFVKELSSPIPSYLPSPQNVYTILRRYHCQPIEYIINSEVTRQHIQGIFSKAREFTPWLSMVLFALEQSINKCVRGEDDDEDWSNGSVRWSYHNHGLLVRQTKVDNDGT